MLSWKALESAIALASCIAKDYLKYKTSDTKEKKALENDIEQNPENFINSENKAIAKEAADLLDDDKRNDEVNNDALRQEDAEWANQLRNQYQSEAPEQFERLTEDDVDWAVQMLDEVMGSGKKKRKTKEEKEANREWLEQTQAADAYAMNNPEQYKQVGAFLSPATDDVVPFNEDTAQDDVVDDIVENVVENTDTDTPNTEEQPVNDGLPNTDEQSQEEDETTKRRNNFLDKFRRSISVNPANGSFTAKENKLEASKGGAVGKGINNISGQSGGVGVNAALDNSDEKEIEMKEYKEQRNVDKELHYDDVPIEQMSSVNNPGANNGNTGDGETGDIKVPNAHSSFSVKKNEIEGHTDHAYGTNKVELDKIKDDNDLEEVLKSLDDYSMFEPLVIKNINDEILVNGHPLRMLSDGTLKYIENKLRK